MGVAKEYKKVWKQEKWIVNLIGDESGMKLNPENWKHEVGSLVVSRNLTWDNQTRTTDSEHNR